MHTIVLKVNTASKIVSNFTEVTILVTSRQLQLPEVIRKLSGVHNRGFTKMCSNGVKNEIEAKRIYDIFFTKMCANNKDFRAEQPRRCTKRWDAIRIHTTGFPN